VDLRGRDIVGKVVVTVKVMPESPEVNLEELQQKVGKVIEENKGAMHKAETQPIGFGLNALLLSYIIDEDDAKGGTDPIDKAIMETEGVNTAETTEVTKVVDVSFG